MTSTATRINPALLSGWGVRPYDWQFAVSVQQELMPRVAVDIGYSRRWWGNFTVTDNLAVGPAGLRYLHAHVTVAREICRTSGQPVSFQLRNLRTPFGAVDNFLTLANNYGDMTLPLAWRRHDGDRPHGQRADTAGRLHDRRGHTGSVRHLGGAAGDHRDGVGW